VCSEPACLEGLRFTKVRGTSLAAGRTAYAAILHDTRSDEHLHLPGSDWRALTRPSPRLAARVTSLRLR
jgi:hypothetical protein